MVTMRFRCSGTFKLRRKIFGGPAEWKSAIILWITGFVDMVKLFIFYLIEGKYSMYFTLCKKKTSHICFRSLASLAHLALRRIENCIF